MAATHACLQIVERDPELAAQQVREGYVSLVGDIWFATTRLNLCTPRQSDSLKGSTLLKVDVGRWPAQQIIAGRCTWLDLALLRSLGSGLSARIWVALEAWARWPQRSLVVRDGHPRRWRARGVEALPAQIARSCRGSLRHDSRVRCRRPSLTSRRRWERHFLMDVRPSSGQPFRTEVNELPLMFSFRPPAIGAVIKLECDPRRRKARFVRSDPAINKKTAEQQAKAQYEAELHAGAAPPEEPS